MLAFRWQCPLCKVAGSLRMNDQVDIPVGARLVLVRHGQRSPRCPAGLSGLSVWQVAGPPVEPRYMRRDDPPAGPQ